MKYTIRFQYDGEDDQLSRDFNIDSVGLSYEFDDVNDFKTTIKLISEGDLKLNSSFYVSKGGFYDISDSGVLVYSAFVKNNEENTPKNYGYSDFGEVTDDDLLSISDLL